ncbi:hypothetical protein DSO57_1005090 [Entomophthora muscae]|uniref:Uncharacterized protein n=1 Tax=Entomophthora muscae TaxID=34485 RepID=A0ACC2RMR3_9FUNG|nr:hypothetical protein DSO57_1005090 [Entomophthora muscae]
MFDGWVHKICKHLLDPALIQLEELTQLGASDILVSKEIVTQVFGGTINLEQIELSAALGIVKIMSSMLQSLQDSANLLYVRNDNLDAPKSQNMESELNPGQNPLQTARLIDWEHNNPLLIDEVAASPPGPEPLAAPQDSAIKLPVQDAGNFPEVPTPDTGGFPGEIDKFLPESYSELLQSPREGTEPKEANNTQINKQKDLTSSHLKAASGKLPVLSARLPSETSDANLPKSRKPDQVVKPGSVV